MMDVLKIICDGVELKPCLEESQMNSMLVYGNSRSGKTFFAAALMAQFISNGNRVVVIDLGDKWSIKDKQMLIYVGAKLKCVEQEGITLYFEGKREVVESAKFIADALGTRSVQALTSLRNALGKLCDENDEFDLATLLEMTESYDELSGGDKEWGKIVRERVCGGDDIPNVRFKIDDGGYDEKSMICDLSGVGNVCARIITYLIVYGAYSRHKRLFRKNERQSREFIVIDEFQNLELSRNSILGICLTEGAKYDLNMVLLTQFFSGHFSEGVLGQFKQAGFRFYFRLTEEDAHIVSRQLISDIQGQKELYDRLINLPVGCCLMKGPHYIGKSRKVSNNFRFVKVEVHDMVFDTRSHFID